MLNDKEIISIKKIFHEQGHIAAIEEFVKIKEEFGKNGGYINSMQLAYNCTKLKKYDKAVEYYHKAYETHDPNMPYLTEPFYDVKGLKKHPGFIEILKKMKLPLE